MVEPKGAAAMRGHKEKTANDRKVLHDVDRVDVRDVERVLHVHVEDNGPPSEKNRKRKSEETGVKAKKNAQAGEKHGTRGGVHDYNVVVQREVRFQERRLEDELIKNSLVVMRIPKHIATEPKEGYHKEQPAHCWEESVLGTLR